MLMLLGAVAELATLGSVMPFLAAVADPSSALSSRWTAFISNLLGLQNLGQIILPATILFVSAVLIAGAIRLFLTWASLKFVFRISHDLSAGVYKTAIYQPYNYHGANNTSELIAGIDKVQVVTFGVLLPLMQAAIGSVITIFVIGALLAIDAGIVLVAAGAFASAYLAISFFTRSKLRSNSEIIARAQTNRVQAVQEGFGGIRDVLLDHAEPIYFGKFATADLALRNARTTNLFIGSSPRYVVETFSIVLVAALAFWLGQKPGGLTAALPVLGALAFGAQKILPAANNIYNGWAQIKGNQQLLLDVLNLMELPVSESKKNEANILPVAFNREIELADVSFGYGDGKDLVVDRVSLTISKGSRIAFVGKTGSGKSTIVDIIMGLLEPTSGSINIDVEQLSRKNIKSWQKNLAHVAQDVFLIDASIAENIAFGVPFDQIDEQLVHKAAAKAALSSFVENMRNGYDTVVGERGIRLSGGQKQRIGLARAFYKQADVLILDEATSALDHQTEHEVIDAIEKLDRNTTILTVAHRLSPLSRYDQIFRVEDGKVFVVDQDEL